MIPAHRDKVAQQGRKGNAAKSQVAPTRQAGAGANLLMQIDYRRECGECTRCLRTRPVVRQRGFPHDVRPALDHAKNRNLNLPKNSSESFGNAHGGIIPSAGLGDDPLLLGQQRQRKAKTGETLCSHMRDGRCAGVAEGRHSQQQTLPRSGMDQISLFDSGGRRALLSGIEPVRGETAPAGSSGAEEPASKGDAGYIHQQIRSFHD